MENNKANKVYKVVMLILITAIVTFMITSIGMYNYFMKTNQGRIAVVESIEKNGDDYSMLNAKLQIVKDYLNDNYIGELNLDQMIEGAIKGYVEGVGDDYTEYLSKDEYEELIVNVTGDFVGIGVYIYKDQDGNLIVLAPMENSPSEEAGIEAGDRILAIDGENCNEMDINVASSKIKGEAGSTVELEIQRGTETLKKTVTRRTVEISDSASKILDGNIGYIVLSTFDTDCSKKIKKYMEEFQSKGINSVILDLRNNTGGVVEEAVKISELFIDKGNTVLRSYNKTEKETIIKSSSGKYKDINLVVLVNDYSASASEIVTAALKDNKAATIVGIKTYGKGVMQEIQPLFDGAIKITIEEFKTPNGDKINKVGIKPDVEIEIDKDSNEDLQLQKAIEILK
jgi:carboxyl-terminal processing protease